MKAKRNANSQCISRAAGRNYSKGEYHAQSSLYCVYMSRLPHRSMSIGSMVQSLDVADAAHFLSSWFLSGLRALAGAGDGKVHEDPASGRSLQRSCVPAFEHNEFHQGFSAASW
jgi:hypothetical protein